MRKPAITLAALFLSVVMGHGEANSPTRNVLAEGEKAAAEPEVSVSARLRAAAASEREIAESLIGSFKSILGARLENLSPTDREMIRKLEETHDGVSKGFAGIEMDLAKQAEREGEGAATEVLKGMSKTKARESLGHIGKAVSLGHFFTASQEALSLSKHFDACADLLEGKAPEEEAK